MSPVASANSSRVLITQVVVVLSIIPYLIALTDRYFQQVRRKRPDELLTTGHFFSDE
jgi:hypothetical protein